MDAKNIGQGPRRQASCSSFPLTRRRTRAHWPGPDRGFRHAGCITSPRRRSVPMLVAAWRIRVSKPRRTAVSMTGSGSSRPILLKNSVAAQTTNFLGVRTTTRVRFDGNCRLEACVAELSRAKICCPDVTKSRARVFQQNRPSSAPDSTVLPTSSCGAARADLPHLGRCL